MDSTYDIIICGTGLTECVLSGLLSTNGYKVLHIDRNDYYGGACASLDLDHLYKHFNGPNSTPPTYLGKSHQYNVDLIPKILMSAGELCNILRSTVVERYSMEFMLIDNSFVFKDGKIHKVPATETEALSSGLMGFFEKRSAASFFCFMHAYDKMNPKTHKGYDLNKITMSQLFKEWRLGDNTIDFIGHGVALHTTDDYLHQPAYDTVMRCKMYEKSFDLYGSSPYVYPMYGSGELPQAFSRLCAVYGGTFMLSTDFQSCNFNEKGVFQSITSKDGIICKAKMIIGDPSYFSDRVRKTGQRVVRTICIMNKPIPNTRNSNSCQIIIPQKELNRRHDIYVLQLHSVEKVCPTGFYIAIIGTVVENATNPSADVDPGFKLLNRSAILAQFTSVTDMYEPLEDGVKSHCFISKSYDAATHFETTAADIISMFERIHGKKYSFGKKE